MVPPVPPHLLATPSFYLPPYYAEGNYFEISPASMSIPLRAQGIDLFTLIVGKGSNFLLTVILFAIASHGMDAIAFSAFGYWWSIGIMVGGVFLGGMSSAAVRSAVISSSLRSAVRISTWLIAAMLLTGLFLAFLAAQRGEAILDQVLLVGSVSAFGICVMLQGVVFGLLRAFKASRSNTIASAVVVLLVPGLTWLISGSHPGLLRLFGAMAAAFAICTALCIVIGWSTLRPLIQRVPLEDYDDRQIVRDVVAFSAINFFSYAAVNIDFTLIKWIGTQDEFVLLASGKVYFERFVLPALMVFAGAISMNVLRYEHQRHISAPRIGVIFRVSFVTLAFLMVALIATGYFVFSKLIRDDLYQLAWLSAIAASSGYLLFAFNAVLFDVLVLRLSIRAVMIHVLVFVLIGGAIQWLAFFTFRVQGWALGWLAFNSLVTVTLAFQCLHITHERDVPSHIKKI
jgi:hypothetical protein